MERAEVKKMKDARVAKNKAKSGGEEEVMHREEEGTGESPGEEDDMLNTSKTLSNIFINNITILWH